MTTMKLPHKCIADLFNISVEKCMWLHFLR